MKQASTNRRTIRRGSEKQRNASTTRAILGLDRATVERRRIDSKWAWHYRVLVGLRERLLKDRGEQLAQAAEPLESYSMDMADSATDEFDHDLALTELSAEQDALYEVDEAIKRILNGTYGICEETCKPIPAARLKAIPWARFIKEVEARLESKGLVRQAHLGKVRSVQEAEAATLAPTQEELDTKEVNMEKVERLGKEAIREEAEAAPAEGREEQQP
jgi:RNA polymerase-binding transcription factor DksA